LRWSFIPSAIASFLLIRFTDLDKLKQPPFGKYIDRYMTGTGAVLAFGRVWDDGSWSVVSPSVADNAGLAVILLAWGWGVIAERIKGQE